MTATHNVEMLPIAAKPSVTIVIVTPDMARRWLDLNLSNRRLRPQTWKRYARDITAGAWQLTGEPIKFASDGTLIDGQHRLRAIIEAGVPVALFVARGLPRESQRVMDTGRARTASDALSMRGEKYSALLAALARLILAFENGDKAETFETTHSEVERIVDTYPGVRQAAEFAAQIARRTDIAPAVVAYTYWRFGQIDVQAATRFWLSAADKVGLAAGDPTIAMTNRFAEARRNRELLSKRTQVSLIFRAWNAWRAGKSMRFLRVNSPKGGLVDVPEIR